LCRGLLRGEPIAAPKRRLAVEALDAQLFEGLFALFQALEAHAAKNVLGLRKLDLAVLDDLDVVAPGIEEVDGASGLNLHARLLERSPSGLLVVDDEAEVAVRVGRLRAAGREGDELVAHVDESHAAAASAQAELEDAPVKLERLLNAADLESDVVQTDEPWSSHLGSCYALTGPPRLDHTDAVSAAENKALVRRFYEEVWDRGNFDVCDEVFAADYVRHDLRATEALPGPEGQKRIAADFRRAFPDLRLQVDILVAEEDYVVGRWTASGTHQGAWGTLEPSGRRATFSAVNVFRFENGKVAEIWNHRDDLGLREQICAPISAGVSPDA
jgi:steroid delta-isomerase-like uncharacterized protein